MTLTSDQILHETLIHRLCQLIHKEGKPLVLKGGTALRMCYGLNRYSEDIDLDSGTKLKLNSFLQSAVRTIGKNLPELRGASIQIKKDTPTTSRYILRYGDNEAKRLKIEVSHRVNPDESKVCVIDGILTYTIDELIRQKLLALSDRTAARDLHDVVFLATHYFDQFSPEEQLAVHAINDQQGSILSRFAEAYQSDGILTTNDLLADMVKLQAYLSTHTDEIDFDQEPAPDSGPSPY